MSGYVCPRCGGGFDNPSKTANIGRYSCPWCGELMGQKRGLSSGMRWGSVK